MFKVSDNGRGFPEECLKRFRELEVSTGVGLAGMRERVRELGGDFEIQSDASGTTVQVMIPESCAYRAAADTGQGASVA
jgi:signal transduction histidine kinase